MKNEGVRIKDKRWKRDLLSSFMITLFILSTLALSLVAHAQERALSDLNLEWLKKKEQALRWGRDPFMIPGKIANGDGEGLEGEFRLSAIIYRMGRGVAIINNQIVRKGDALDRMEVVEILQDRVILRDASGEQKLRVNRFALNQ